MLLIKILKIHDRIKDDFEKDFLEQLYVYSFFHSLYIENTLAARHHSWYFRHVFALIEFTF